MRTREFQLRRRNVERGLRAECSGLDLDVPVPAIGTERQDVISETVAVIPGRPSHTIGQAAMPAVCELPPLELQNQLLTSRTESAVLLLQQPVVDMPANAFPGWRGRRLRRPQPPGHGGARLCAKSGQHLRISYPALDLADEFGLIVPARLIAADVRQTKLNHRSADIRMLELDCLRRAASTQPRLERPAVLRLRVVLASRLSAEHCQIIRHSFADFDGAPLIARIGHSSMVGRIQHPVGAVALDDVSG